MRCYRIGEGAIHASADCSSLGRRDRNELDSISLLFADTGQRRSWCRRCSGRVRDGIDKVQRQMNEAGDLDRETGRARTALASAELGWHNAGELLISAQTLRAVLAHSTTLAEADHVAALRLAGQLDHRRSELVAELPPHPEIDYATGPTVVTLPMWQPWRQRWFTTRPQAAASVLVTDPVRSIGFAVLPGTIEARDYRIVPASDGDTAGMFETALRLAEVPDSLLSGHWAGRDAGLRRALDVARLIHTEPARC